MIRVYEGYLSKEPVEDELCLLEEGQLYLGYEQIPTDRRFYFFDLYREVMLKWDNKRGLRKEKRKDRVDDLESRTCYIRHDQKWLSVKLPNLLPDISIQKLEPKQTEFVLGEPEGTILIPLKSSDFQNIQSGVVCVAEVTSTATLAYIAIDPCAGKKRLVYDLFDRKQSDHDKTYPRLEEEKKPCSDHKKQNSSSDKKKSSSDHEKKKSCSDHEKKKSSSDKKKSNSTEETLCSYHKKKSSSNKKKSSSSDSDEKHKRRKKERSTPRRHHHRRHYKRRYH